MRDPGYLGAARREGQVLQIIHRLINLERLRCRDTATISPCAVVAAMKSGTVHHHVSKDLDLFMELPG